MKYTVDQPGNHFILQMPMTMYFTLDWYQVYVLFQGAQITEKWHLVLSCILIAVAACLYEGLKVLR